jgi:hypothetical protein
VASSHGKRILGACGHEHEFVFNQFALCTKKGCDGKPGAGAASGRTCKQCNSTKMNPFSAPLLPDGAWSCFDCGRVSWEP